MTEVVSGDAFTSIMETIGIIFQLGNDDGNDNDDNDDDNDDGNDNDDANADNDFAVSGSLDPGLVSQQRTRPTACHHSCHGDDDDDDDDDDIDQEVSRPKKGQRSYQMFDVCSQ